MLKNYVSRHPDGECHTLLALTHHKMEDYESAAAHYEAALTFDPVKKEWRDWLEAAKATGIGWIAIVSVYQPPRSTPPPSPISETARM